MKFTVKDMDIATGGIKVVILNAKDAASLDLHSEDRLKIKKGKKETVAVVDIAESKEAVPYGKVGLFEEVIDKLHAKSGDRVEIFLEKKPESVKFIRKKLNGKELTQKEIFAIVKDTVDNKLTDIELTYYVSANYTNGMTMKETVGLTKAMIDTGDKINWNSNKIIVDKHSIGGVPGNRTTMGLVPILASLEILTPKTSSRAITSPAGTADTMEVLADVSLSVKDIQAIVKKHHGCIVWGGAVNLAPADDTIINVEHPLSIDAEGQLLASIMAKKGSVNATHVIIDIPIGKGAKVESRKEALHLKKQFEKIGKGLGMKVFVIITDGSQPIGNGIGPALEARDVLWVLKNDKRAPQDLKNKILRMAAVIIEECCAKKRMGLRIARDVLESGLAYKKMVDIIKAQGPKITNPDKIKIGSYSFNVKAKRKGKIAHIDNVAIAKIARMAGCPQDHRAGLYLHKHKFDKVRKGETLFTIYAESKVKLKYAKDLAKDVGSYVIK